MNMANVLFENSVSGNEKCHDSEGVSANTSNAPIEKNVCKNLTTFVTMHTVILQY